MEGVKTVTDDELRALLQEVDPARDLTRLSTHHVRAKAEDTMTTETPRRRAARPRGRTRILLGAGVGVVAATVVVLGVVGRGDPSVTRLTAAVTDPTASCAVLSPDLLTDRDTAFAARAVAVSGVRSPSRSPTGTGVPSPSRCGSSSPGTRRPRTVRLRWRRGPTTCSAPTAAG